MLFYTWYLLNSFLNQNLVTMSRCHFKYIFPPNFRAKFPCQLKVYIMVLWSNQNVKWLSFEIHDRNIMPILQKILTNPYEIVFLTVGARLKHNKWQIHDEHFLAFLVQLAFVILEVLNKKVDWVLNGFLCLNTFTVMSVF